MFSNPGGAFQLDLRDFEVTLSKIKVSRLTFGHGGKVPKVSFDLGADMKEIETVKGRLRLKYTLFIDASPAVERAELAGEVAITSPAISSVTDLQALGEEKISDIAMKVYSKNYETLYLVFDSLGLTAPSPFLIQDVHIVQGEVFQTEEPIRQVAPVPMVAPIAQ